VASFTQRVANEALDQGFKKRSSERDVKTLHLADCHPIAAAPGTSRLYADFCAGEPAVKPFFGSVPPHPGWQARPALPGHWAELVDVLAAQNGAPTAGGALAALRAGAGIVVTGQQVGLFGGPLFTPLKAATALARARQATAGGQAHAAVFWLATEDHDFAEINHVTFPSRRELKRLVYDKAPAAPVPVGGVVLDETIAPLME
jgi:bacillithiol synthase